VVDSVLHHRDSCSDILFYIDVHKCRSNESCDHHIESLDWSDGKALVCLSILPDTQNHHDLYELDDYGVHENIGSLRFGEVHTELLFLQVSCESHGVGITCEFEPLDFSLFAVVDTLLFDRFLLLETCEQAKAYLFLHLLSAFIW